jgi:hypothetical protein
LDIQDLNVLSSDNAHACWIHLIRVSFAIVAIISLALVPAICVYLTEPPRGDDVLSTISEGSSSNRHRHIDDDDDADDGNISGGSSSSRSSSELVGSAGTARRRQRKRHLGLWAQIQLIFSRRTFLLCEKTHLYAMPFYTESASFYQDRLGTNIGKALKKERDAFSQVGWAGCCGEHAVGCF